MSPIELARIRAGTMRWMLLVAIDIARPQGIYTEALLPIIQATYKDATHREIRLELDYLEERELVRIEKDPTDKWFVDLKRKGIEVVKYDCHCDPGILRPEITRA